MKIETRAYRSGSYRGQPVWRGKYRITEIGKGFEVGWTLATNNSGFPISYEDKEAAEIGAKVCGEQFAANF